MGPISNLIILSVHFCLCFLIFSLFFQNLIQCVCLFTAKNSSNHWTLFARVNIF